ncbi:hypothetical protein JCM8097_001311 [Rhodosporidiobolus ruineniae]
MEADRFTQPLPDYLTCPVCLEAAWEPFFACESEHTLCEGCFQDSVLSSDMCPVCREPINSTFKCSPALKRALGNLSVFCQHRGCDWVGPLVEEQMHGTESCQYRKVQCDSCERHYAFADFQKHYDVCPEALLVCPRGGIDCGGREDGGLFCRKDEREHEEDCSNWPCSTLGCPTRTTRRNLPAHEQHCSATLSRLDDSQSDLRTLADELTLVEEEAFFLTDENNNLERENQELRHESVDYRTRLMRVRVIEESDLENPSPSPPSHMYSSNNYRGEEPWEFGYSIVDDDYFTDADIALELDQSAHLPMSSPYHPEPSPPHGYGPPHWRSPMRDMTSSPASHFALKSLRSSANDSNDFGRVTSPKRIKRD